MTDTRGISEPIKRQVRQECYFGCVICGMPVFQYDHIQPFAEVQCHDPTNLALLCPNHHQDKTSGRLSAETVASARSTPFNANQDLSRPYGLLAAPSLRMCLGSNCGSGPPDWENYPLLWINGEAVVSTHKEGDAYTYSARITDEGGEEILVIDHGALAVATGVWDYRYEGREVSIRRANGDILFEATIADDELSIRRGSLLGPFETGLVIKPDGVAVFTMSGLEIGSIASSAFTNKAYAMLAIVRKGAYSGDAPPGGGMMRSWTAEYEQLAADLRMQMEAGEPGQYPPGLGSFRPYPRT